ncbi:hypothetical protein PCASD_22042 [Puccinia coronata f. sp. avenae]|uniref:Uncharacterized protein n=1 Tax=Puccinia coronata f. sp. avenae TaxID=200324 RepID=A0A2N5T098_9BASI|nr:hypothetical protein PCASD_22042 [Puccinia coronata f. sp. avenae]
MSGHEVVLRTYKCLRQQDKPVSTDHLGNFFFLPLSTPFLFLIADAQLKIKQSGAPHRDRLLLGTEQRLETLAVAKGLLLPPSCLSRKKSGVKSKPADIQATDHTKNVRAATTSSTLQLSQSETPLRTLLVPLPATKLHTNHPHTQSPYLTLKQRCAATSYWDLGNQHNEQLPPNRTQANPRLPNSLPNPPSFPFPPVSHSTNRRGNSSPSINLPADSSSDFASSDSSSSRSWGVAAQQTEVTDLSGSLSNVDFFLMEADLQEQPKEEEPPYPTQGNYVSKPQMGRQ